MEPVRYVEEVNVKEMEKRRYPEKFYTYITEVIWNDRSKEIIARRYSDFFDLHTSIMEEFPIESGVRSPRKRIVPYLPGKVFFLTENKARKRIPLIDDYCKQLIRLPTFITYSDVIISFFEQNGDDKLPELLNRERSNTAGQDISGPIELEKYIVITDFQKESSREISLKAGEVVELLEKSETGWWLVFTDTQKRGWAPAAYLEDLSEDKLDGNNNKSIRLETGKGTWYVTLTSVTAETDEELSFNGGEKLEVLEQNMDGWWFARSMTGKGGWVPGSFLNKLHSGKSASAAETRNLSKRRVLKRAAPKRGTVHKSITQEQRQLARKTIREKLKKQFEPEKEEIVREAEYITIAAMNEVENEGMNFEIGEVASVIQKSSNGWWLCRIDTREGWIPESYLEKRQTEEDNQSNNNVPMMMPKLQSFAFVNNGQKNDSEQYYSADISPENGNSDFFSYSWFKDITRQEAETLLQSENKEGYYVVRKSKDHDSDTPYSITIFHQRKVWHFHIRKRKDNMWAVGNEQEGEAVFSSLPNLVNFYSSHNLIIGDINDSVMLAGTPA